MGHCIRTWEPNSFFFFNVCFWIYSLFIPGVSQVQAEEDKSWQATVTSSGSDL